MGVSDALGVGPLRRQTVAIARRHYVRAVRPTVPHAVEMDEVLACR